MATCGWSQQVRLTMRRMRLVVRSGSLRTRRLAGRSTFATFATFADFSLRYSTPLF